MPQSQRTGIISENLLKLILEKQMIIELPLPPDECIRCFRRFGIMLPPPVGCFRPQHISKENYVFCVQCKLEVEEELKHNPPQIIYEEY